MKFIIQLFGQYIMKKILYFMFILMLLISCQLRTSKTTITTDNYEKDSKANF